MMVVPEPQKPSRTMLFLVLEFLIGISATPKPVSAMERAIKSSSKEKGLVYEPFAGSGTTIIAAHNLNRRCYAMEISEKYGAVILERFYTARGITPELVIE